MNLKLHLFPILIMIVTTAVTFSWMVKIRQTLYKSIGAIPFNKGKCDLILIKTSSSEDDGIRLVVWDAAGISR